MQCSCGGTAWITREDGYITIECTQCRVMVSGETLTLAKQEWRKGDKQQQGTTRGRTGRK